MSSLRLHQLGSEHEPLQDLSSADPRWRQTLEVLDRELSEPSHSQNYGGSSLLEPGLRPANRTVGRDSGIAENGGARNTGCAERGKRNHVAFRRNENRLRVTSIPEPAGLRSLATELLFAADTEGARTAPPGGEDQNLSDAVGFARDLVPQDPGKRKIRVLPISELHVAMADSGAPHPDEDLFAFRFRLRPFLENER
jgi:hypothetical protein